MDLGQGARVLMARLELFHTQFHGLTFLPQKVSIEDEVRFIQRPQYKWVYRIGGIVMLLVTMNLAGVI